MNGVHDDLFNAIKNNSQEYSPNKIRTLTLKDIGNNDYSFILNSNINIKDAWSKALKLGPDKVIAEVTESNLVGRGGAGFKTGIKWQGWKNAKSDSKYLIWNAD